MLKTFHKTQFYDFKPPNKLLSLKLYEIEFGLSSFTNIFDLLKYKK